jgi:UDP-glucose 4-epimerase
MPPLEAKARLRREAEPDRSGMNSRVAPLRNRSVLVTGASGYLGSTIVELLLAAGSRVIGLSRTRPSVEIDDWEPADLRDRDQIDDVFRRRRPELVLHLAGITNASRVLDRVVAGFDTNAFGTVLLLEACKRHGCERFVYCGSMEAPPARSAEAPASPYGASKWVGTAYTRLFQSVFELPTVILRPFFVYGPGRQPADKLVPYVMQTYLRRRRPRLSSPERKMDWVFIDDVAEAFLRAACMPNAVGCELDVGTGRLTSIREFVELVRAEFGGGPAPVFDADPSRAAEVSAAADTQAVLAKIGWAASTPLEEGVRRTVDWYRRVTSAELASCGDRISAAVAPTPVAGMTQPQ